MGRFVQMAGSLITGGFLSGHRTYILGAGIAFQAFVSWAVLGEQTLFEFVGQLPEILGGAGLMTARAALDKVLAEIRGLHAAVAPAAPEERKEGWNASGSGPTLRSFALPLALVLTAPLLLTACASTPEARWAQAQTAYNEGVEGAVRYRKPCVDFGPEHPLCKIDDDLYRIIEPIRERLDSLLAQADAAIQAGNVVGFEIYMEEVDKLLETFLLYTIERGAQASEIQRLRELKDALAASHQSARESAHHENEDRGRCPSGSGTVETRPLSDWANRSCEHGRAFAGAPGEAVGGARSEQRRLGSTGA